MKNMGMKELILINPVPYQRLEAYALAHRSRDILDKALVYDNLAEALKPFAFVIGTTQRVRGRHYPLHTPSQIVGEVEKRGPKTRIALVFGRESRGLTNEELRCCHMISTIPTALRQPALNLAQAVMVYGYELYKSFREGGGKEVFSWDLAHNHEIYHMYEHMDACLQSIRFHPRVDIKDFIDRFRRVLGRIALERRDVKLFHKLFAEVERAVRKRGERQEGV